MQSPQTAVTLSDLEIDAIGEIMNISMGAAATAMSTMLDKQVIITTPNVTIDLIDQVNYSTLEPAMMVKITYVKGISGSNVMVFRQMDMQVILNQLMGRDDPPSPDFVFDELSMSAACEVMNQMMGASATALSGFLGKSINISTPEALIMDPEKSFREINGLESGVQIVSIKFDLNIDKIISSEFIIVMGIDLAHEIVSQLMGTGEETVEPLEQALNPTPAPAAVTPPQPEAPKPPVTAPPPSPSPTQPPMPPMPPMPNQPQPHGQPMMPAYQQYYENMQVPGDHHGNMPPMGYGMPPYYPPYGYPMYPPQYNPYPTPTQPEATKAEGQVMKKAVNVQNPQFPSFTHGKGDAGNPVLGGNMDLIMNVSLNVSVEIGKTRKKIKDILDYAQGTVIELEKQAGAPVDIIVNGQLIARGDVVVIDDNFGVRITEILGTKDLLKSL